jgi:exosortase
MGSAGKQLDNSVMNIRNRKRDIGDEDLQPSAVQSDRVAPSNINLPRGTLETTATLVWPSVSCLVMFGAIVWAYWPTLGQMAHNWEHQPDYSHGYLVVPIALFFLWSRRRALPWSESRPSLWGGALLVAAMAARVTAGMYYLVPLDGWTLPLTVAGVVWLLFGRAILWWSLPSIVFLWFMVPIPYRAESWLSVPMQAVATKFSTAALVFLGQPAIAEGNTIFLGDHSLFVEEACSGMRILVGVFALAFAFALFSRWKFWLKGLVLLTAVPVAIATNVIRIVMTGLLYQWFSNDVGRKFSHDISGFVMIPLAALIFWLLLVYLDKLFPQLEVIDQPSQLFRPTLA